MKLLTSYFANNKALNKKGILMIGISRYPPTWFRGLSLMELAPQSYMLKLPPKEYDKLFAEKILGVLDQKKMFKKIEQIALKQGKTQVALCCFETEQIECHRHNVAEWFKEKGFEVEEFVSDTKLAKIRAQQERKNVLLLF